MPKGTKPHSRRPLSDPLEGYIPEEGEPLIEASDSVYRPIQVGLKRPRSATTLLVTEAELRKLHDAIGAYLREHPEAPHADR